MKIYNEQTLLKEKKREIRAINNLLKDVPKIYKKKKFKRINPVKGRHSGALASRIRHNKLINQLKNKSKKEIKEKIKEIEKMNLIQYLSYLNRLQLTGNKKKKEENEDEEDEETMDSSINKILKLENIHKENKNIFYNLAF